MHQIEQMHLDIPKNIAKVSPNCSSVKKENLFGTSPHDT